MRSVLWILIETSVWDIMFVTICRSVNSVVLMVLFICVWLGHAIVFWGELQVTNVMECFLMKTCESSSSSFMIGSMLLWFSSAFSKRMMSLLFLLFLCAGYLWMEWDISGALPAKLNSMHYFYSAWHAHGSPSIYFYNTSHSMLSIWSLSCTRQDKLSRSGHIFK